MSDSVIERFKPLFEPKTVAVVGASTKGTALPNVFIRRIREFGYAGAIYPIHPSAERSTGCTAYRSLGDTPEPVDYAYIAIAAAQVPPLLEEARGRVRFAQVISSGFGEVDEGKELQERAGRGGARGRHAPDRPQLPRHLHAARARHLHRDRAGGNRHVGIVSQSGGLGTDIIRRGFTRGLKFSGLDHRRQLRRHRPQRPARVLPRRSRRPR